MVSSLLRCEVTGQTWKRNTPDSPDGRVESHSRTPDWSDARRLGSFAIAMLVWGSPMPEVGKGWMKRKGKASGHMQ